MLFAAAESEGSIRRLKRVLVLSCCSLQPQWKTARRIRRLTFLISFSRCSVDGSANDRRELGSQSTRCGASRDGTSMLPPTGPGEGVCGGRVSVGGDLEPSASYTCHVGVVSSAVAKAGPRGDDVLVVSSP
ncbi:hypothetical protein OPV22_014860 [Ensete ventricosum]|uniref:Uncharacterized protein n=1 Tax=Ensete ventricosum TaxID=4639 RepID=A0AAV8R468_ENSVE|nr:hypothetical protein OPV22_014860 [Ensete ventricosum]